jgi:uncharacterized protein YegL
MNENTNLELAVDLIENQNPRCPCVLVLDTSGSMYGEAIDSLNQGLLEFKSQLQGHAAASKRVEVAIVTFDSSVQVVQDFVTVDNFEPPVLEAEGLTCMGSAIHQALDMVEERKSMYRQYGTKYYRPWVFLITDGEPQGEADGVIEHAARRLREDSDQNRVAFYAVGVKGANMDVLKELSPSAPPLPLAGLQFRELFQWLSNSMSSIASGGIGEQAPLAPVTSWSVAPTGHE